MTGTSSSRASVLRPREICPICSTRFSTVPAGAHELQVVDQDQAEPVGVLLREPARLGADVEHREVRGVVDVERRLGEPVRGLEDLRPARRRHLALAQVVAADRRLRGDEPLRELGLGHLEREQRHGLLRLERRVLGEVGHQRRLPHRRPCGEDDQVAGLEAAGDGVEVVEAGGGAGDRLALAREALELVELGLEQVVDRAEVLAAVLVGDLEDRALGHVDEVARERLVAVHARLDLVRGAQQAAEHRVVADDAGVLADVADRGDRAGQQVDRRAAADALEVARLLEVLDERQRVDRLAERVQVEHRLVDARVALAVEVVRVEALVDDQRRERRVREQDGAEHRLLGLEVLGRRDRAVEAARARRRGRAVAVGPIGGAHRTVESRSATGRSGPASAALPR